MTDTPFSLPPIADGEDKSSPLKNRIRKIYRHLKKWATQSKTNCFRVYDRDIKEYPLVIDYYNGRFCVQYFSYDRNDDEASEALQTEINDILGSLFNVTPDVIYWRSRIRRRKLEQYERKGERGKFFTVQEYGVKFKINLQDYLDTGLFLDHRETRRIVASLSAGKRVLNLFAYTGSFSVHAALAGAIFTKSVDLSNTYTDWTRDNLELNSLPAETNEVVRADCLKFLTNELRTDSLYDIVVIDPPTISRSKKMDGMFDVQKDYPFLISSAIKLLSPGGEIFFSTNSRKFIFDSTLFSKCSIREISEKTDPVDFRKKNIHRCWRLSLPR